MVTDQANIIMFLQQLDVSGFRNLSAGRLQFSPEFNAFWGDNGSGKTSILEAIHVLGVGRSFRSSVWRDWLQFNQARFALGGKVVCANAATEEVAIKIGTQRSCTGAKQVMLNGKSSGLAELAKLLPLQVFTADAHQLIAAEPEQRRKFVDWAMFHVEHNFWPTWQTYKQALTQRNAMLRQERGNYQRRAAILAGVAAWDEILINTGTQLSVARQEFLAAFQPLLLEIITAWLPFKQIELQYQLGWAQDYSLAQALAGSIEADLALGYTSKGPHRADVEIVLDGAQAKAVLSRGQQKLLVCAMLLGRAKLLQQPQLLKQWSSQRQALLQQSLLEPPPQAQLNYQQHQQPPQHHQSSQQLQQPCAGVFLLDDLHAELDEFSCNRLLHGLAGLGCQVFITNIAQEGLMRSLMAAGVTSKVFRVQAGEIREEPR